MGITQYIPGYLKFWFFVSALTVFFDASFVLQRPQTMKGGSLYHIYHLYDNYIIYDTLYSDLKDSFVVIQSWLNIVQGVFLLISVFTSFSKCNKVKLWSSVIGVLTSTMVFWKTVIFVWYDHAFISDAVRNIVPGSILCYWLPNSLWLIFPLLAMILIPHRIICSINAQKSRNYKKDQ